MIVNDSKKQSLRGAKRHGNLMRLPHFVRNDDLGQLNIFKIVKCKGIPFVKGPPPVAFLIG
jgi:hypothetical protein